MYRILADLVVGLHFVFVVFVVVGGLLVLRWPKLAYLHIPAVVYGAGYRVRRLDLSTHAAGELPPTASGRGRIFDRLRRTLPPACPISLGADTRHPGLARSGCYRDQSLYLHPRFSQKTGSTRGSRDVSVGNWFRLPAYPPTCCSFPPRRCSLNRCRQASENRNCTRPRSIQPGLPFGTQARSPNPSELAQEVAA